jgi:transketolase
VDVATGSLGQGLPYGVGIALADQRGPTELEWDMAAYQRRAEAWLGDAG